MTWNPYKMYFSFIVVAFRNIAENISIFKHKQLVTSLIPSSSVLSNVVQNQHPNFPWKLQCNNIAIIGYPISDLSNLSRYVVHWMISPSDRSFCISTFRINAGVFRNSDYFNQCHVGEKFVVIFLSITDYVRRWTTSLECFWTSPIKKIINFVQSTILRLATNHRKTTIVVLHLLEPPTKSDQFVPKLKCM